MCVLLAQAALQRPCAANAQQPQPWTDGQWPGLPVHEERFPYEHFSYRSSVLAGRAAQTYWRLRAVDFVDAAGCHKHKCVLCVACYVIAAATAPATGHCFDAFALFLTPGCR